MLLVIFIRARHFYSVFYAKQGLVFALISIASLTFFKGGNAINLVLAVVSSVKIHGQVFILRAIKNRAVFGSTTAAYNKLLKRTNNSLLRFAHCSKRIICPLAKR